MSHATTHPHAPQAQGDEEQVAGHAEPFFRAHHVCPPSLFLKVLVALLCLTVVTVWIGQFNFGSFNMFLAMGIAAIKASLVMTFFMHLKYDTAVNNIFILSSFFFLGLLFLFTLSDFVTRGDADPKLKERAPLENVTPLWDPPHRGGHGPDAGHGHK